jgi:hypothetical protein
LVPNSSANILVITSPSNPASRSLIITPATDKTGTALITVKVTDEGGKFVETSFTLTVTSFQVANDFNGDGTQDIVYQDNGGFLAAWFMTAMTCYPRATSLRITLATLTGGLWARVISIGMARPTFCSSIPTAGWPCGNSMA